MHEIEDVRFFVIIMSTQKAKIIVFFITQTMVRMMMVLSTLSLILSPLSSAEKCARA